MRNGHESDGREPPFREDLNMEAEEQPLLEAVTRKSLVNTLLGGKYLAFALVNCEV
jgi:hypothetical protein